MTALAIRGSRFQNGVSRIHGEVSSRICAPLWPQIDPADNRHRLHHQRRARADLPRAGMGRPVREVSRLRLDAASDRRRRSGSASTTSPITCSGACANRSSRRCCTWCATASRVQHFRNGGSRGASGPPAASYTDPVNPNVLTIGFARRFATYKRATLAVPGPRLAARDHRRRSSVRCCSFSPARRIRPTGRARI